MIDKPLDELYLEWLYSQVGAVSNTDASAAYWKLSKLLSEHEFVWLVPNDDNRAEDGRALRVEFLDENRLSAERLWTQLPCSVLELLIALSRRLAFEAEGEPSMWYWELINNLGLYHYRDNRRIPIGTIKSILDDLVWRTYEPTGHGGLFPLKYPEVDQREVEIWYQLQAYLLERE